MLAVVNISVLLMKLQPWNIYIAMLVIAVAILSFPMHTPVQHLKLKHSGYYNNIIIIVVWLSHNIVLVTPRPLPHFQELLCMYPGQLGCVFVTVDSTIITANFDCQIKAVGSHNNIIINSYCYRCIIIYKNKPRSHADHWCLLVTLS